MDKNLKAQVAFGCEACWPDELEAAWLARRSLATKAELVDESHYHVMVLACAACCQHFVSVFTEMIDWIDGDDPQYWTVMPISDAEVTDLLEKVGSVTEAQLNALGPGRRCLQRDYPKGKPARLCWGRGILVGPHD